jgi:hypothetical protein
LSRHSGAPAGTVLVCLLTLCGCDTFQSPPRIGVVYLFHGGSDDYSLEASWNSTTQIFAYDPHSRVYQGVIWNPQVWPRMLKLGNAPKERRKYEFEYARIGGSDPANTLTRKRYTDLRAALEARESELGVDFISDYASWLAADPSHHMYPRSLYTPGVEGGAPLTYCGSDADGGPWPGCNPQRYNTDGTIERLLAQNVEEILIVDMTTSGVRFFKSFDAVNLARQVVARHNAATGRAVQVWWINDPTDLMTESYPARPAGWTRSLGPPQEDRQVPLAGRPNPVSSHPELAGFHADGIEAAFAPGVALADTGVMLVNHATRNLNQLFDPKIDDTLVLNRNIKAALQDRHPDLQEELIVGSWMGRKELNPENGRVERTRAMRGENLGEAWLYETDRVAPDGEWGFRYWEALEYLKNRGAKHIVIAFPQIMVDSVLNLVEVPNQVAKELGYKNWLRFGALDRATYPDVGHPFADHWGIWVDTQCPLADDPARLGACCFEMGGCDDGRPYPPPRTTPLNRPRDDLDPSLAFDVSAYGHLGYDAARGRPDNAAPVQEQFRGTWEMWRPPNGNGEVGEFLADRVVEFFRAPRPEPAPAPIWLGAQPTVQ